MVSRAPGVSSLESATPLGPVRVVASTTTTPTLTGPASAPRPTSSMPATRRAPEARSALSCRSVGTLRTAYFPAGGASGTPSKTSLGLLCQSRRSSGHTVANAVPTTLSTGTNPPPGLPRL